MHEYKMQSFSSEIHYIDQWISSNNNNSNMVIVIIIKIYLQYLFTMAANQAVQRNLISFNPFPSYSITKTKHTISSFYKTELKIVWINVNFWNIYEYTYIRTHTSIHPHNTLHSYTYTHSCGRNKLFNRMYINAILWLLFRILTI